LLRKQYTAIEGVVPHSMVWCGLGFPCPDGQGYKYCGALHLKSTGKTRTNDFFEILNTLLSWGLHDFFVFKGATPRNILAQPDRAGKLETNHHTRIKITTTIQKI
jgi:hypothetical protein